MQAPPPIVIPSTSQHETPTNSPHLAAPGGSAFAQPQPQHRVSPQQHQTLSPLLVQPHHQQQQHQHQVYRQSSQHGTPLLQVAGGHPVQFTVSPTQQQPHQQTFSGYPQQGGGGHQQILQPVFQVHQHPHQQQQQPPVQVAAAQLLAQAAHLAASSSPPVSPMLATGGGAGGTSAFAPPANHAILPAIIAANAAANAAASTHSAGKPLRNKGVICKRHLERQIYDAKVAAAAASNNNGGGNGESAAAPPTSPAPPSCKFAHQCPYRHVTPSFEEPIPRSVCKFYIQGACLRDNCPFFHGPEAVLQHLNSMRQSTYKPSEFCKVMDAEDPEALQQQLQQQHEARTSSVGSSQRATPATSPLLDQRRPQPISVIAAPPQQQHQQQQQQQPQLINPTGTPLLLQPVQVPQHPMNNGGGAPGGSNAGTPHVSPTIVLQQLRSPFADATPPS